MPDEQPEPDEQIDEFTNGRKKYARHAQKNIRINLSISPELVKLIDEAAEQDYTTRSDMIRMAILWFLRPQGRELNQADPEVILKTLKHRQALRALNKEFSNTAKFDD